MKSNWIDTPILGLVLVRMVVLSPALSLVCPQSKSDASRIQRAADRHPESPSATFGGVHQALDELSHADQARSAVPTVMGGRHLIGAFFRELEVL